MIIKFEQVKRSNKVKGKCALCGRNKIRTVSVMHTVNPFNKNEDGSVKDYAQVLNSVNEDLLKKVKELENNFVCKSCKEYL